MAEKDDFNIMQILSQRSKVQLEEETKGERKKIKERSVMMIDVDDLVPSVENFYQVDDSLKQSIELVGILQPLLVNKPENGKYKVIAGHRRRLAVLALVKEGKEEQRYVPCVYKEEDIKDKLALIMANRFRDKSDWEKMREIVEAEELARELKREHGLEGRTRDILAQIIGMSQAQIGRYKAIYNNLDQRLMELFKEGTLNFSVVSELCGLPPEWQKKAERLIKVNGALTLPDIKELKERREREEAAKRGTDNLLLPERPNSPKMNVSSEMIQEAVIKKEPNLELPELKISKERSTAALATTDSPCQIDDPVKDKQKNDQKIEQGLEISGEAGEKQFPEKERIETDGIPLSVVSYGDIRGYIVESDKVCRRRVYVCPVPHDYGETGEKAYIKYSCPICEMFGNNHSFSRGMRNCPLCSINLRWESEGLEIPEGNK